MHCVGWLHSVETHYAQFILTLHSLLTNTTICKKLSLRLSALPRYESLLQLFPLVSSISLLRSTDPRISDMGIIRLR